MQKNKGRNNELTKEAERKAISGRWSFHCSCSNYSNSYSGTTITGYRLIQIYNVTGNAYVNRENQEFKAYENLIMQSEDSVMTHSESFVRMKLDEDKYVLIEEDTVVGIVASGNKKAGRTDLDLREGSVTVEIDEHLTGNSSFTVTTPNSVMAVRGTVFRVALEYDENGVLRTHITVWEGNVEVLTSDGNVIIEGNPNLDKGKEAYVYLDGKVLHMNPCPKIEYEKMPKEIIPFLEEAIERERDIQLPSQEELAAIFAPESPDDGPGGPGGSGGPSGLAEPAPAPAEQTSQPEESVGDTQAPTAADVAPAAPVNPVPAQELLLQPVPAEITPTPAPTQSSSSGSSSSSRGGSSGGSSSNAGNQANTNQDPQQDPNQNQQDPQQDPSQSATAQEIQDSIIESLGSEDGTTITAESVRSGYMGAELNPAGYLNNVYSSLDQLDTAINSGNYTPAEVEELTAMRTAIQSGLDSLSGDGGETMLARNTIMESYNADEVAELPNILDTSSSNFLYDYKPDVLDSNIALADTVIARAPVGTNTNELSGIKSTLESRQEAIAQDIQYSGAVAKAQTILGITGDITADSIQSITDTDKLEKAMNALNNAKSCNEDMTADEQASIDAMVNVINAQLNG